MVSQSRQYAIALLLVKSLCVAKQNADRKGVQPLSKENCISHLTVMSIQLILMHKNNKFENAEMYLGVYLKRFMHVKQCCQIL